MWKYKTNKNGEFITAVIRRIGAVGQLDLSVRENRSTFGYCYLEYVNAKGDN